MTRRDVRDLSRHRDEAELFYADLIGIRPRSNAGRAPRVVAPPIQRPASRPSPPSAELLEAEPNPLVHPDPPADDARSDPPFEADSAEDDTGEAVPLMDVHAEAAGDESDMEEQSPVPFEELLAIDTSEIVESWDDRSSAT
jgi:hypothetical protein